jgi:putative tryptophan/tyrosine transport system substrate-binding protein
MRRREFIMLLGGGAAARPLAAHAQQPRAPLIGFLYPGGSAGSENVVEEFRKGLAGMGWVEGRNVAIEFRWAEGHNDRLPELAADLVRRRVAVIVTLGTQLAARAAKAPTATIPIIYGGAADPVQAGLVASLNRPGGNVTGYTEINIEVTSKRLNVLHDLMPSASHFALLVDPDGSGMSIISDLQATASANGLQIEPLVAAATDRAIEEAIAGIRPKRIDALMVSPSPTYYALRAQIAALAVRYVVPVIYWDRTLAEAGGLISYGSSVKEMFRQVGIYAGRILMGEKPADMPVMQASKFELVINLKSARAIGLTVPPLLLAQADEVIE